MKYASTGNKIWTYSLLWEACFQQLLPPAEWAGKSSDGARNLFADMQLGLIGQKGSETTSWLVADTATTYCG